MKSAFLFLMLMSVLTFVVFASDEKKDDGVVKETRCHIPCNRGGESDTGRIENEQACFPSHRTWPQRRARQAE